MAHRRFPYALRAPICRAAGGKEFAAKHGPARLWFERHAVSLAALIANYLEPLAFRSSSSTLARAAKVLAARVAARFATLGMAQATLPIIVLFSFSKRES